LSEYFSLIQSTICTQIPQHTHGKHKQKSKLTNIKTTFPQAAMAVVLTSLFCCSVTSISTMVLDKWEDLLSGFPGLFAAVAAWFISYILFSVVVCLQRSTSCNATNDTYCALNFDNLSDYNYGLPPCLPDNSMFCNAVATNGSNIGNETTCSAMQNKCIPNTHQVLINYAFRQFTSCTMNQPNTTMQPDGTYAAACIAQLMFHIDTGSCKLSPDTCRDFWGYIHCPSLILLVMGTVNLITYFVGIVYNIWVLRNVISEQGRIVRRNKSIVMNVIKWVNLGTMIVVLGLQITQTVVVFKYADGLMPGKTRNRFKTEPIMACLAMGIHVVCTAVMIYGYK
jgi:hypothetical protein